MIEVRSVEPEFVIYKRKRIISANGYPIHQMSRKVYGVETRESLLSKVGVQALTTRNSLLQRGVWQNSYPEASVEDLGLLPKFLLNEPPVLTTQPEGERIRYCLSSQASVFLLFHDGRVDPLPVYSLRSLAVLVPAVLKTLEFNC